MSNQDIKTERFRLIEEIFREALKQSPNERAAFLQNACAGDESLCEEIEARIANQASTLIVADEHKSRVRVGLSKGDKIGPFDIDEFLGEGGYGEVYLAWDPKLRRQVALKILSASSTKNEARLRRFEQEARAASAANHHNICTIYEVGETPGGLRYIVMEHVDGMTLHRYMPIGGVGVSKAIDISVQVATALAAAHAGGVVHRDIKPENIMVRRDGVVKVLDFGIAKLVESQESTGPGVSSDPRMPWIGSESAARVLIKTKTGVPLGTPLYMSPEQIQGSKVDARTDIWSLGVVLYEMTMGHVPFEGETVIEVANSILNKEPLLPTKSSESFPTELRRIVTKALSKDKEQRYQTAKEILADLSHLKRDLENDGGYLKLFVREKSGYYLAKWKRMEISGRSISFNWAAFLAGPAWLLYRKMYLYAIPLLIILCFLDVGELISRPALGHSNLLSSIVIYDFFYTVSLYSVGAFRPSALLLSFSKFLALLLGCFGNTMYRSHVERKLRGIVAKELPRDPERDLIRRKGGTSIGAVIGLLIFFLFATLFLAKLLQ